MNDEEILHALEKAGFSIEDGLSYSGDDTDFYFELLGDYAASYEAKCAHLNDFLESESIEDYRIEIHALKSTSRTIGAEDVFSASKSLEDAAKSGDLAFIRAHHDECLRLFQEKAQRITALIPD